MMSSKKGDLFETPYRYIAHGCNAQGVMGSGVAKQIREKYPEAYLAYKSSCDSWKRIGSEAPLGSSSRALSGGKTIYNLITQQYYGKDRKKYVSYDAIDAVFWKLRANIPHGETLAIPQIGAGLGGGDWNAIREIIKSASDGHYNVCVYER